MAKGAKTGGRQPGSLNKATVEFRQTVQKVLEENASNVGKWLTMVAEGVPPTTPDGKGVEPDPGKALDLMAKLAEYAAPKLARTEHTGAGGGSIDHSLTVQFVGQKP